MFSVETIASSREAQAGRGAPAGGSVRVRGEKSENKWRRGGGRRPARGEGGGLQRGEGAGETALAGGAVGGLSRARTCGSPEGDKCAGGPEREKQAAQTRPGPQRRLR